MLQVMCALTAVVVVLLVLLRLSVSFLLVSGPSMTPALRPGRRVLFVRRGLVRLRTGRIVVLSAPSATTPGRPAGERTLLVKRVVAMAGDPIPTEVCEAASAAEGDLVPDGQLVVLGDNPDFSTDSRFWGVLPMKSVVGIVLDGSRARPGPDSER